MIKEMKSNKEKFKEAYKEIMDNFEINESPELVRIVWKDACTESYSHSYKDLDNCGLATAVTVGYLIKDKKDCLVICPFLFPDKNRDIFEPESSTMFKEIHVIPKSQIKAMIVLQTDWEATKKNQQCIGELK